MSKQCEKSFKVLGFAAICALAGLIVYIVTSVTGYLGGFAGKYLSDGGRRRGGRIHGCHRIDGSKAFRYGS